MIGDEWYFGQDGVWHRELKPGDQPTKVHPLMNDALDHLQRRLLMRHSDYEAWHEKRDEQNERYQWASDAEGFEKDAHDTLVMLKRLCERSDAMGYLNDLQRLMVGGAWLALEQLFPDKPDHQDEKPF